MTFTVSPGVVTREIELTTVVPEAGTTSGGFAGVFGWGPVNQVTNVISEESLKTKFGKPNSMNFSSFFTAANFLAYGNNLNLVRVANTSAKNASAAGSGVLVNNDIHYEGTFDSDFGGTPVNTYGSWIARYPGALGNSLKVSICAANKPEATLTGTVYGNSTILTGNSSSFDTQLQVGDAISLSGDIFVVSAVTNSSQISVASSNTSFSLAAGSATTGTRLLRSAYSEPSSQMLGTITASANSYTLVGTNTRFDLQITAGDTITIGGADVTVSAVTNATHITLSSPIVNAVSSNTYSREWEYYNAFDYAPATSTFATRRGVTQDEIHVVVVDEDGEWTNLKGSVLETFTSLSVASDAKAEDGSNLYYKTAINRQSNYLRWMFHPTAGNANSSLSAIAWGSSANSDNGSIFAGAGTILTHSLTNGLDGAEVTNGEIISGYDHFKSNEVDASLLPTGNAAAVVCTYIINNIAEVRKDCMVLCSPPMSAVVNNVGSEATDIISFRNQLPSSSFAIVDSGYKYQYDKYNDTYRYVPLNGDVAGLMVRTALERDFFFSPAGFTRGQIKNVVRLPYNPQKPDRDELYKNGINPVVAFPGQGTILFGDKTLLAKSNAFDRINVRRLFITLEKSISTFAQASLFEFNDEFTRARFVSSVEPYLRDIQGRGGITDFAVICDETNNTPEVIDRSEFVGSIYVKPQKSINYILLNFVAVRSGVEFSEIVNAV